MKYPVSDRQGSRTVIVAGATFPELGSDHGVDDAVRREFDKKHSRDQLYFPGHIGETVAFSTVKVSISKEKCLLAVPGEVRRPGRLFHIQVRRKT